jgi:hypothetical protein
MLLLLETRKCMILGITEAKAFEVIEPSRRRIDEENWKVSSTEVSDVIIKVADDRFQYIEQLNVANLFICEKFERYDLTFLFVWFLFLLLKLLIFCEFCEKNMSYVQKLNHNVENTDVISFYPVVEWQICNKENRGRGKNFTSEEVLLLAELVGKISD